MKKNIKLIVSMIFIACTLFLMSSVVKAGTVTSFDVTEGTSSITVSGTTTSDLEAVSITINKQSNGEFVKLVSAEVDDEDKFSETISLPAGTYTVKVADYDGGTFATKENVVVGTPTDDENEIGSINITLKAPIIGESVTTTNVEHDGFGEFVQDNKPDATVEVGANYEITETMWITGTYPEVGDGFEVPISATFEKDKYYYASISVSAKTGYKLANDVEIKVNGETPAEVFAVFDNGSSTFFIAKIKATDKVVEDNTDENKAAENNEKLPQTGDMIRNVVIVLAVALGIFIITSRARTNKKVRRH